MVCWLFFKARFGGPQAAPLPLLTVTDCPLVNPFFIAQLQRTCERFEELNFLLQQADVMADMARFMPLAREHAEVSAVAQRHQRCLKRQADAQAAQEWQVQWPVGHEMHDLACEEVAHAQREVAQLQAELQRLLLPQDPLDVRNAFIEIRAGTGGDESALFAADLMRMYARYCQAKGWAVELLAESPSELGGYKEVVARVVGQGAYGWLRWESGGHRVQRVPVTETQGRIHTSACTVAVLAEPDEARAVQINPADLRIDTYRASGAGGQHVNKTDSAVRITHLPTGTVAECQDDRSQHRNKARAMQVLCARIEEKERSARAAQDAALRKGLVGSGDRSDRIRTYNFPQGRLTDHRIHLTLHQLPTIMEGDLDDVLVALQAQRDAQRMAQGHA